MKKLIIHIFIFFNLVSFSQEENLENLSIVVTPVYQGEAVSICRDEKGFMWFDTKSGIFKYDGYSFNSYLIDTIVKNNLSSQIPRLFRNSFNHIFYGNIGLGKYDPNQDKFIPFKKGEELDNTEIYDIQEDNKGVTWIASASGLFTLNNNELINLSNSKKETLEDAQVFDIDFDPDSNLLLATGKGLIMYHQQLDEFSFLNKISTYKILNTGDLTWMATDKGLVKYHYISNKDTLYLLNGGDETWRGKITSFFPGVGGELWIGSQDGLYKYIPGQGIYKLLLGGEASSMASLLVSDIFVDKTGILWIGTSKGVYKSIVDAEAYIAPPVPWVTSISFFKKDQGNGKIKKDTVLKIPLKFHEDVIKVPFGYNNFVIEYTGLHYVDPSKNRFIYMLSGYDKEWVSSQGENKQVVYRNLDAGEYVFRLQVSNSKNVSLESKGIKIIITPPFWKSWWFYSLLVISVILFTLLLFRFIKRQIKKEREILKAKYDKRLIEIERQKGEIERKNKEILQREEESRRMKWFTEGLAKFGELLSKNKDDTNKLCKKIISEVVNYFGAIQGGIYLYREDHIEPYLELVATFAYDKNKLSNNKIEIGEGLVGSCFKDKKMKVIDNLPPDYLLLKSGLGDEHPEHLLLIPLKYEEIILGVMEVASFSPFNEGELHFAENIAERITSVIFTIQMNEKTNLLLEQAREQANSLQAREDELRQTIEEMQAAKEELERVKSEEEKKHQEMLNHINEQKESLMDILDKFDGKIFLKDKDGKIILANRAMADFHQMKRDEIIGKTDFDLFEKKEQAQSYWEVEQEIMKKGEQTVIETVKDGNHTIYVESIKTPFDIKFMGDKGLLGIQKDITEVVHLKQKVEQLEIKIKKLEKDK
ncbi:MAG: ligand-binding sensor domain-containing protein [bacterium]